MKKWFAILLFAIIGHTASAQDLIVKCNAEEINAKVLSVSTTDIEYQKSDNLDGPIYKLPISEISYIKYKNGTKDVFAEIPHNPKLATGPGPVVPQGQDTTGQNYGYRGNDPEYTPNNNIIRRPRFTHHSERYPYYQGEVAAAYGLGLGLVSKIINTNRIVLETIHGARLCPYFFVGGGLAFNYFYSLKTRVSNGGSFDSNEGGGAGIVPIFANAKGYYPVSAKCAFYLSLDLGVAIPASGLATGGITQFYTAVGPGINFGNGHSHSRGDFSIRFQHMGVGLNAMLFRIGLGF